MAWEYVLDKADREWRVERNAMYALVRDHVRAVETRRRAVRKAVSEGFMLPTLTNIEIDYNGLREEIEEESQRWWSNTQDRITRMRGEELFDELVSLRKEARDKNAEIETMQREAMRETQLSINSTVDGLEAGKKVLEFVRDLSATVLVVGSAFFSGGASIALLGAGSSLKGASKFQDTGNIGAATLEATSSMVVGAIGISGQGFASARALLFIGSTVDGALDGAKALVDGQSGKTALVKGFAKFGVQMLGGRLQIDKLGLWSQVAISQSVDLSLGMIAPTTSLGPTPVVRGTVTYARGQGGDADSNYIDGNVLNDPNRVGAAPSRATLLRPAAMQMRAIRAALPRR
ncbi:MAG: hypothetical protein EOP23_20020 [Hyphomicrobiales bacterium]|nr:MAG: hypothetical protein EOP23_20020 [Hyphomicrobiales bacterium]